MTIEKVSYRKQFIRQDSFPIVSNCIPLKNFYVNFFS